jgi:hypothetical protein
VALFGRQHRGNRWQHFAPFLNLATDEQMDNSVADLRHASDQPRLVSGIEKLNARKFLSINTFAPGSVE